MDPFNNEVLRNQSSFLLCKEGVDFQLGPTEIDAFFILAYSLRPPESSSEDPSNQVGVIALSNVKLVRSCECLRREYKESIAEIHLP